jgi:hypothetical protein
VRAAGFLVDEVNASNVPTSIPLGIPDPTYWLKLDWIFARGVSASAQPPQVVAATTDGKRVSDHDFVVAHLTMAR